MHITSFLVSLILQAAVPCEEERLCRDLAALGPVIQDLYYKLVEQNLWDLFVNVESALCTILALLELRKFSIDTEAMMRSSDFLKVQLSFYF